LKKISQVINKKIEKIYIGVVKFVSAEPIDMI